MSYRKYLALLLALVMCLSLLPGAAMAEGIELAEDDAIFEFDIPEEEEAIVEAEPEEPAITEEPEEPAPLCDEEPGEPEEPAPLSDAEPEPEAEDPAEEPEAETLEQPSSFVADLETFDAPAPGEDTGDTVVGFEDLGDAALIVTPYKLALIELQKQFPAELNVRLGRSAGDVRVESVAVEWQCLEDYDEDVLEFHFVPVLDRPLADGVEPPVITVLVEGKREQPVLVEIPELPREELPIVGVLTGDAYRRTWAPSYYNAYTQGRLPAIRNQNPYGTCWAHATIGCAEADLIHDGAATTNINLSELHLAYYTFHSYTDEKGCNAGDSIAMYGNSYLDLGGDPSLAVRRMANLVGPAQETDAPYFMAQSYNPGPDFGRQDNCSLQLSGFYSLNMQDREAIKYNIMTHGGVAAAYYHSEAYYSSKNNSYFVPLGIGINHSIMLVGWDDSFSRDKFAGSMKPTGDGAWLVRNSWGGTGYGYYSYFWISYYDESLIRSEGVALDVEANQYDYCYAYDSSPFSSYYTMASGVRTEQSFKVNDGERIKAVGVETGTASLNLSIKVSCGNKTVSKTYATTYPGYYLIPLDETILVTSDAVATVAITYTGSGSIKIPVEHESPINYSGVVYTASCGGGGMVLYDPDYGVASNVGHDGRIKLFTRIDHSSPATFTVTWTNDDGTAILKTERHDAPYTPAWTDAEPVKANNDGKIYIFDGWTIDGTTVYNNTAKGSVKAFEPLYTDATFRAHFVESPHNEEYLRSLSLTDSIAVRWRISKTAEGADASKYSAVVTYKGQSTTYASGLTSGIVLANCTAQEMTEDASVNVYYDGVLIAEDLRYSVNDYCREMIASAEMAAWHPVMQALQDYGYTAQKYYNSTNPLPDGNGQALAAAATAVPDTSSVKTANRNIGITNVTFRVFTEAQTTLSIGFWHESGRTADMYTFTLVRDGEITTVAAEDIYDDGSLFEIRVRGIAAKDLGKTIEVYAADKNNISARAIFRGSAVSYMSAAWQNSTDAKLKAMVLALYNYYKQADARQNAQA